MTIRILGVDIDLALYGWINDWHFPFLFVPTLRGLVVQVIFLSVFLGRIKEVPQPSIFGLEEA